jgi:hypothetical protein
MANDPLVQDILQAPDAPSADAAVTDFVAELRGPPPEPVVRDLLDRLRSRRFFGASARLADALTLHGVKSPYVRRQHAQSLIDQGQVGLAVTMLEAQIESLPASEVTERSETLGLLGRAFKQQFILSRRDRQRAGEHLQRAVKYYGQVYSYDPAWHGANLVALAHRAEQEGIAHESKPSEAIAQEVLRDLAAEPRERWKPWTWAGCGEAHLALNQWKEAAECYGVFANAPTVDAFALHGAARQLREIWGVEPGSDHPAAPILMALEARTLTTGGHDVRYSPKGLALMSAALKQTVDPTAPADAGTASVLQAILGANRTQTLHTVLALLRTARAVCQVVDRHLRARSEKSGGTGFLVRGDALGLPVPVVLMTNNHVLSKNGLSPSVRAEHADAIFDYWLERPQSKVFRVKEILWESPREQLDVTLALLEDGEGGPQDPATALTLSTAPSPFQPPGTKPEDQVYLVGHPDGRGIELSLSDNRVLDHEVADHAARACHRIHYMAPTERGMSGSPVLEAQQLHVVGIHRAGGNVPPLRDPAPTTPYRANEAVWIGSIIRQVPRP